VLQGGRFWKSVRSAAGSIRRNAKADMFGSHTTLPGSRLFSFIGRRGLAAAEGALIHSSMRRTVVADPAPGKRPGAGQPQSSAPGGHRCGQDGGSASLIDVADSVPLVAAGGLLGHRDHTQDCAWVMRDRRRWPAGVPLAFRQGSVSHAMRITSARYHSLAWTVSCVRPGLGPGGSTRNGCIRSLFNMASS